MATVRPEGTGDKIVTLEELALAYDTLNGTKIAKDISQLDSIVGDPASTDYFMLGRNGVEYKVDYDALATAIINKLGLPLSVANGGSGLSASPSLLTNLASSSAANVMQASPRPGVTGTLPVANGGSGLSASPSLLTNLASSSAANVMQASPRPGVTGTLPVANGGTGATTAGNALDNLGVTSMIFKFIVPANGSYALPLTSAHQVYLLLGFIGGSGCAILQVYRFNNLTPSIKNLVDGSEYTGNLTVENDASSGKIVLKNKSAASTTLTAIRI